MFRRYLITGATGFLGRAVISELNPTDAEICALVLDGDPLAEYLPRKVNVIHGDISNPATLEALTAAIDPYTCVIHCAGIVSVASAPDPRLDSVNVQGTQHLLNICIPRKAARFIYVSSVHAIQEKPMGIRIEEPAAVAPELVCGHYAKSKASATGLVLKAAADGLNACVVYPSGLIGPGDLAMGSMTHMLLSFLKGRLPFGVDGGYDFVDVRDVAEGIVRCSELGRQGQGYILSGHYTTIKEILNIVNEEANLSRRVRCLPIRLAGWIAPYYEKYCLKHNKPLFFTPYAVSVLDSNAQFSRQKALQDFSYAPRPLRTTLRNTVAWLQDYT